MSAKRSNLGESATEAAKKQAVPTEAEVVRAVGEWEEGAAYRKVRHAANVGGCYSSETICLVAQALENQRLTDNLVSNRLAHAEFSTTELNPMELGAPSVAEFVSIPVLNRLLKHMRGTFTPEQANHFTDYHITECDEETLRIVADKTSFTAAQRREFFELTDWMVNPEFAPTEQAGKPQPQAVQRAKPKKGHAMAKVLLTVIAAVVVIAAIAAVGAVALAGVALLVIVVVVAAGTSSADTTKTDKFPDVRSDYNRRVWAAEHNYDADGDDSHNYEADGDYPW